MDPKSLISLLGKAASFVDVNSCIMGFGAKRGPKLKKGDIDAYVELPKAGLEFVFTDQAFLEKRRNLAIGEGELILTNITFYSDKATRKVAYSGILPFGISFSDNKTALHARLGQPELSNQRLNLDRWTRDGLWIFIRYVDNQGSILSLSIQTPDAP